jgi:hypothetical protein
MADFEDALTVLEQTVTSDYRGRILLDLSRSKDYDDALARLRTSMRSNLFRAEDESINLESVIRRLDNRTCQEGFHVLQDWDGKAAKLNKEIIPVDMLDYVASTRNRENSGMHVLAILLDYYFVYVLALLAMRAWDSGDANDNLDRITRLLRTLQENGSGQQFVENAETLIFIATSHFEPDDCAYDRLLDKIRTLDEPHQVRVALVDAAILGSHLRFGFGAQYARDLALMRSDNAADYPWLLFSLATLMRSYARTPEDRVVEGILNGLTPDTRAFLGKPPASLLKAESEHSELRELLFKHKQALLADFERHRPSDKAFSPLAFNFNFPHNLFKAIVADALFRGQATGVSMNDLLSASLRRAELEQPRMHLIHILLAYARSSPDIIRGRPMPIITYDPFAAIRTFNKTTSLIKEYGD